MCITHGHIFMTLGDPIVITHTYAWVRLNSHCSWDILTVRDVYSCWNHVSHLTALKLILNYSDCSLNQNDFGIIVKRNNISPPVYVLRKQADCWHWWAGRGERCKMSINTAYLKSTDTLFCPFEVCTCNGDIWFLRPYVKTRPYINDSYKGLNVKMTIICLSSKSHYDSYYHDNEIQPCSMLKPVYFDELKQSHYLNNP